MANQTERGESGSRRIRTAVVLQDGVVAGLLGGLAVSALYLVLDALAGEPFRTPSVLVTLLFEGAAAARAVEPEITRAVAFNAVHFPAWLVAGTIAAWIVNAVEAHPVVWYLLFVAVAFSFGALLYLDGALGVPALGRLHLFGGAIVGSAAMCLYLWWQHPGAVRHLDDIYPD